jgi:RNA polymerase II subunit A-like phosphatase
MKREVLRDVRILFSGLIALNDKPEESEFWQMANTFGATCLKEVDSQVTHVAATQVHLSLSCFNRKRTDSFFFSADDSWGR